MKNILIGSILALSLSVYSSFAQSFNYDYVKENGHIARCLEIQYSESINVADKVELPVKFHVTARGNGRFICGNLDLHVFDRYYDGTTYLLDIDIHDVNSDGYKDIVIYGAVNYSTAKDRADPPEEVENVLFIYLYEPEQCEFSLLYKNASFDLEETGDANTQWWNRML